MSMPRERRERKRLGDLLVESKVITQTQLLEALEVQKKSNLRLGQVLIQLGFVTEQGMNEALEIQLGIPQVALHKIRLDPKIVKLITGDLARRHKVIPIEKRGNILRIAMADPLNLIAIDDLQLHTGLELEPVIATEAEVDRAISRFFGLSDSMKRAFGDSLLELQETQEQETIDLDELVNSTDDAPIIKAVNVIIQQSVKEKASDIHIEPGESQVRIRYRIDGLMQEMMELPKQIHAPLISRVKIMADLDIAEKRVPQDGRVQITSEHRQIDLRVSTLPTIHGEKVVIRLLDKANALLQINELGMQSEVNRLFTNTLNQPYGLLLITGPTGSGKTTSLYAALNFLNHAVENIVTIEDPVEYVLEGINQVQVNTKAGMTFSTGLRSILRQDPDIIMVGEIRDVETAQIAIRAATTGHKVLSTLHTNDAASTLARLIDLGVEPFMVASSIIGVLAQRLVRTICSPCKVSYTLPVHDPLRRYMGVEPEKEVTLYKGDGCSQCNNTGYKGRTAIHELMVFNKELRELVADKAPTSVIHAESVRQGMITLKEDGLTKVYQGKTTIAEVMRVAYSEEIE